MMKPRGNYIFVQEEGVEGNSSLTTLPDENATTKVGKILAIGPDVKDLQVDQMARYTIYKLFEIKEDNKVKFHIVEADDVIAYE